MLLLALLGALIMGLFTGGRLNNLRQLTFRGLRMVPVLLIINIALLLLTSKWTLPKDSLLGGSLHSFSYVCLLWLCILNLRLPGMPLIAGGILLNAIVVSLNGGAMPVDPSVLSTGVQEKLMSQYATHTLITADTNASILADWIYLTVPILGKHLISLGDIVMDIGAFIIVYQGMKRKRRQPTNII